MATKLFDLSDKIALVTGASRGIGEQAAILLAEQGAHVIVTSRRQDVCEQVVQVIKEKGGQASAHACHIGDPGQIDTVFEYIKQQHGKLDILVNNAAANPYYGHILDTDLNAFTKTVDVNIRGYFFMSINAGKIMKQNGGGAIVNVASVNGVRPGDRQGIYSITKAAIVNMTKAFALECGEDKIRVNAVLPGLTNTKLAGALTGNTEILDAWLKEIPLRRYAEPEEIAGTILYLASDAASFVTGSCVTVDGGYLI